MPAVTFHPLTTLPLIAPGDDLGMLIAAAVADEGLSLRDDDILVVAQKIVSKSENCFVRLGDVVPSPAALALAEKTDKDPRLVEVVLGDTAEVIRAVPGVLIVAHKLGFISANAGIDHSNVAPDGEQLLLRLPADPDASARALRERLCALTGARPPVLIIDSHGRPWRFGTVGVTIGVAGLVPVEDWRGRRDLFGTPLQYTEVGFADQVAAGASLLMGQAAEGAPAVVVRDLPFMPSETARAADALRPVDRDLFR